MAKSSERYFLGGLLNDIDKDINPDKLDKNISNDETTYKTLPEQPFSSVSSNFSQSFPMIKFSPSNNNIPNNKNSMNVGKTNNINNFLIIFKNQKLTKEYQKKLETASMDTIENVVNELSGKYRLAIKNKNGNYFCSDLIKKCNKEQRLKILKELSNTISQDSIDEFGSHVIQKLIEFASGEEEYNLLLFSFNDSNSILKTSMNPNGTYIIQKLIVHIPEKFRMKFNLIFVNFVLTLSKDAYGVFTVKKFIGYTQNELIRKQLLSSIYNNILYISTNEYGNYLVQYLLEKWWKSQEGVYLKKIIFSKFLILASNYYSSFICDLFYKLCNDDEKKTLTTFIKTNNKMLNDIYKNNDIKNNRIPTCIYQIMSNDNNNNQK